MNEIRKPVVLDVDDLPPAPDVESAPPLPDEIPRGAAMQGVTRIAARRPSLLARVFWIAISAWLGLVISVAAWDFVTGLLVRNALLGQIALGLLVALGAVAGIFMLRELGALARLARVDRLQHAAKSVGDDRPAALKFTTDLQSIYRGREELRWARQEMVEYQKDVQDAADLMSHAERTLLAPLDDLARREVEQAARQVASATALIPLALADVVVALLSNIRMVRRIAQVYGGRSGTFGSLRLLRAVATHLVATGAVAVGDDLISSVAGGGALSKISRRFGEGVINGALTARVGVAAMEVCRPMPFAALPRPKVTGLVRNALTGLFK